MTTTFASSLPDRLTSEEASSSQDHTPSRLVRSIERILTAMLAFSPAALGAVQPWSEMVVICLAAAMSGCLVAHLVRERRVVRPVWCWSYLPILLFLFLVGF